VKRGVRGKSRLKLEDKEDLSVLADKNKILKSDITDKNESLRRCLKRIQDV
jgi:hypothetical protein